MKSPKTCNSSSASLLVATSFLTACTVFPVFAEPVQDSVHSTVVQAGEISLDIPMERVSFRLEKLRLDPTLNPSIWIDAIGGTGRLKNGSANADYVLGGVVLALDQRFTEYWTVGLYGGLNMMEITPLGQSESDIGTHFYGAYSDFHMNNWNLSTQVAYARQKFDVKRSVELGDTRASEYDGDLYAGKVELGYDIAEVGSFKVTPYLAGTYIYSHADGFSESGIGGVQGGTSRTDLLRPEAGVKFGSSQKVGEEGATIAVYGKLAVAHDIKKVRRTGSEFTTEDGRRGETKVVVGMTTEYNFTDMLAAYSGGELRIPTDGGRMATAFSVGLKMRF